MRLYTCILRKSIKQRNGLDQWAEFYTILLEAESPDLARLIARSRVKKFRFNIIVELGDTRYNHPGARDLFLVPAQVVVTEVKP
jgi:hypothetical protein